MTAKTIWDKIKQGLKLIATFFGFNRDSKYVRRHMLDANIRGGAYLASIIIVIEVWMLYRQTTKYYIPACEEGKVVPGWQSFMSYTATFWLFLFVALAIFAFSICYRNAKRMSPKLRLILTCCFAGAALLFNIYAFYDDQFVEGEHLSNTLLVLCYAFSVLIAASILLDSILGYLKKKDYLIIKVATLAFFAAMCIAFGIKVSYSDFLSVDKDYNHKEIICFLTMILYASCLLNTRPFLSIAINVTVFSLFHKLLVDAEPLVNNVEGVFYQFKSGDTVNYITFCIALTLVTITIYHQRRQQALRDEELEYRATYDELTGLYNFQHFIRLVEESGSRQNHIMLITNIVDLRTFNDLRGFEAGNNLLVEIGKLVREVFPDAIVCRQSDDHFLLYGPDANFMERIEELRQKAMALDAELPSHIQFGGYRLKEGEDVRRGADKARYACTSLGKDLVHHFQEYDQKMHDDFHLMQYVLRTLDTAISKRWIRPYYQPVVWAKDGTLCGVEALARWEDPKRGLLPPGKFVPTLESTKLVHKLDAAILEGVCRDIHESLEQGLPCVPVSINFSRLDFQLMDVVGLLEEMVAKYNVPKDYLHVEITESALADDEGLLYRAAKSLKEKGYALWLDDFGSGYSSLNVLKDFEFDVMKIDMKFLEGFAGNSRAEVLLQSIMFMAKSLGMRTLTEGVETEEQSTFLNSANCERLQGYLYGKALPLDELRKRIADGDLRVSDHLQ